MEGINENKYSAPLSLDRVQVSDDFWGREQELVRREVIPYQWEALNDRVPGADPSFCMRNFKTAGRLMKEKREKKDFVAPAYSFRGFNALPEEGKEPEPDRFYGFVFQDSDFSKWIEAVGYSLQNHPEALLEQTADEAIDIVCEAQAENGYLDTYYIINGMDRVFTNLRDHHELYCMGHLIEGAVAYYQATGKDKLLKAAMRYADYACSCFAGEGNRGYPGHEIAEMALARLYEVTGEKRYLELAECFLDHRGTSPYYFDEEGREQAAYEGTVFRPAKGPAPYSYYQAHEPVRQQSEAVGHAVRAVYLYSGMADVARLTGDAQMRAACERLWNNIVREKLYITGGIGGTRHGEAFSAGYELSNDTAYSETCAAIGLVFFARRMLELEADSGYADVMEQALYNTVLAGMALDGKSFFYVNPLEVEPKGAKRDEDRSHVKTVRQKWFGCACCPPNIARLVSSLGAYLYTETGDTLYTHLYVGSRITKSFRGQALDLQMESRFPWEGDAAVTLHAQQETFGTLAFRLPGWCEEAAAEICFGGNEKPGKIIQMKKGRNKDFAVIQEHDTDTDGPDGRGCGEALAVRLEKGYLYLTGSWQDQDVIRLHFPMEVHCVQANPRVRKDIGRAAFTRGPICYCMEEADNGPDLQLCSVKPEQLLCRRQTIRVESSNELGHEMRILRVPGSRLQHWPPEAPLYQDYQPPGREDVTLTFLPYYAWNNRGEGEMSVWVRTED